MKKLLAVLLLLFVFALSGFAQVPSGYSYRIRPVTALPASCAVANGEVVSLTAGGLTATMQCLVTNTWYPIGQNSAGAYTSTQGTLVASAPFINHSVTWNNGAVTFTNIYSNVTNTASNAASLLINLAVGGVSQFSVTRGGLGTFTGNVVAQNYNLSGRGWLFSSADNRMSIYNNAGTGFERLSFGPEAVTHPSLMVAPAAGGQTQGLRIVRGDGTDQVFASLGAAVNGAIIYCADCTIASPCAGGGTGSIAKRLNGVWVCN